MGLTSTQEDIKDQLKNGVAEYIIESYGEVLVYTLWEEQLQMVTYTKEEFAKLEKERNINLQFNKELDTILKDPT